jgi:PAP2 superfamily protein
VTHARLGPLAVTLALAAFLPAIPGSARPLDGGVDEPAATAPASPPAGDAQNGDGRRTGGRFFSNFGRDLVGIVSRDNLVPFLVAAGATGIGFAFDDDVKDYFSQERRAAWLGDAGDQLGKPYVIAPMAAALYAWGRLDHSHQRWRNGTYDVAEVTLVAAVPTTILKYTVQRQRPDGSNQQSFPSGHTSNAFAWATVGAYHYGWKLGVPGYLVAGLIGVSRMEKNVHYLSDVIAGAGIGILSGRSVVRKNSEPLPAPKRAHLLLCPAVDSYGGGRGLLATLTF